VLNRLDSIVFVLKNFDKKISDEKMSSSNAERRKKREDKKKTT